MSNRHIDTTRKPNRERLMTMGVLLYLMSAARAFMFPDKVGLGSAGMSMRPNYALESKVRWGYERRMAYLRRPRYRGPK